MKNKDNLKITALYERLSKDDEQSGASFDRPNWKRLIEDVEQGKIGTVIVKDMSRVVCA